MEMEMQDRHGNAQDPIVANAGDMNIIATIKAEAMAIVETIRNMHATIDIDSPFIY